MGSNQSTRKEASYIEELKAEVVKIENKLKVLLDLKKLKDDANEVDKILDNEIDYTERCLKRFNEEVIKARIELQVYLNDLHEEWDQQLMQ